MHVSFLELLYIWIFYGIKDALQGNFSEQNL